MARMKRVQPRNALFHVVSRVAHKEFFFDEKERNIIVDELRRVAAFCGVKVVAYCIMSNHIHLLVWIERPSNLEAWLDFGDMALSDPSEFIPEGSMFKWRGVLINPDEMAAVESLRKMTVFERYDMDEVELLRRIGILYERNPRKFYTLQNLWGEMSDEERRRDMERYLVRMYDISFFMKTLKQNISQYYNFRHKHTGAMWEGRFRTTILEQSVDAMSSVAAYIDLNPVRAGIVEFPTQYHWCSFATAVQGVQSCRDGYSFIYGTQSWLEARELHEAALNNRIAAFAENDEEKEDKVFMSGGVIGSNEFVAKFVEENASCFPAGRKCEAANFRIGDKILRVLRHIRVF